MSLSIRDVVVPDIPVFPMCQSAPVFTNLNESKKILVAFRDLPIKYNRRNFQHHHAWQTD